MNCSCIKPPINQHPNPKLSPTGGKCGSISFCISSAVGARLELSLLLGLEERGWTPAPVQEPFCTRAWSCAWIPMLDSHCLGWHQESVSLQYHLGGLDLIPSAVFSFPQAGRGWECCTDSTACLCSGLHSPLLSFAPQDAQKLPVR